MDSDRTGSRRTIISVEFVLQSPIVGGLTILFLAMVGLTIHWKFKTGNRWFQTSRPGSAGPEDHASTVADPSPRQTTQNTEASSGGLQSLHSRSDQPKTDQPEDLGNSSQVQSIIAKIKQFRPQRRIWDEKQYQDMLFAFMWDTYRSLRREVPFPNKKYIDATIGGIGIELKFSPNESDFDRLYSQVESYLDHIPTVIVVASRPKSPDALTYFEEKLKRRGWFNSRVLS